MKPRSFNEYRDEQLQDPEVRREYEAVAHQFSLAAQVLRLRKELDLTQRQLAQRMGTSQPAIARIESGNYHNVSMAFIRRLADALNAEPEIHLRKRGA